MKAQEQEKQGQQAWAKKKGEQAELCNRIIGKLKNMTDEEFEQLELTEAEKTKMGQVFFSIWHGERKLVFCFHFESRSRNGG